MNEAINLLHTAKRKGFDVLLNGDQLQLKMPTYSLADAEFLEEIRNNKEDIVELLKSQKWKSRKVNEAEGAKAIPAAGRSGRIPLSFNQERLWFIDQMEGSLPYHIPAVLHLSGYLNEQALEHALRSIVERHEVLRMVIKEEGGSVYQEVMSSNDWALAVIDDIDYGKDESRLRILIDELISKPFDLARDYKLRAYLLRLGPEKYTLLVTMHHISSDGWSGAIVIKELVEFYSSYTEGRLPRLQQLALQYADFAIWQRLYAGDEWMNARIVYWQDKLKGVQPLRILADHELTGMSGMDGDRVAGNISRQVTKELIALSNREGVTLYMTLLAAFKILLFRYTNQKDICVISSIAGRQLREVEGMIGFFANILALRSELSDAMNIKQLLQQIRKTTLDAYENQDMPFEKIVELLRISRERDRNPVFQIMFVLENMPEAEKVSLGSLSLKTGDFGKVTSKFDLTLSVTQYSDGLKVYMTYRRDLYRKDTMESLLGHYKCLLESLAAADMTSGILKLDMLGTEEKHQLLTGFNKSAVSYPGKKTIVQIFGEQVQKSPDSVALVFENQKLTYRELDEFSNRLGHHLRKKGVRAGTLVAVCLERGLEMIVGILGVMKAGGAYVPIDPDYPGDRIRSILDDCSSAVILTGGRHITMMADILDELHGSDVRCLINMEHLRSLVAGESIVAVPADLSAKDPVYVIYTSGSTGMPKGVLVEHRSLIDYVYGLRKKLGTNKCRSFALVSTLAADLGNTVIYSALLSGGALHVISKAGILDAQYMYAYFCSNKIDCLKIAPSHWKALCSEDDKLLPERLLIFGGESLSGDIIRSIGSRGNTCRIVNHYGPTETTIGKLAHKVIRSRPPKHLVPIGKPFANTRALILDQNLGLCPIGVTGELYIEGDGLARGYLNRPELTAEKFIGNPYPAKDSPRIYRTGDICRWNRNGEIEYLGRNDDQIKVRGYRVELGEIETALKESGLTRNAAVVARQKQGSDYRIAAYIIKKEPYSKDKMVAYLRGRLPDYMLPDCYVELEEIPLTPNGKIDKHALPDPEPVTGMDSSQPAPLSEMQNKLVNIWQELLEMKNVSIRDNFFSIGGYSLMAVKLVSAIRKSLNKDVSIGDIFDYPTIGSLTDKWEKEEVAAGSGGQKKQRSPGRHLILLSNHEKGLPLFIIPGTGGRSEAFRQLGEALADKYKAYGIHMMGTEKGESPLYNVYDIAARNIQWIRKMQPTGPYRLIGHCFGANIAYEMAVQLQEKKQKTDFVAILDATAGLSVKPLEQAEQVHFAMKLVAEYFESFDIIKAPYPIWIGELMANLQGREVREIMPYISEFVTARLYKKKKSIEFVCRLINVRIHNTQMIYQPPSPVNASLIILKAEKTNRTNSDEMLGWTAFSNDCRQFTVPGDHDTMINTENSAIIAGHLK